MSGSGAAGLAGSDGAWGRPRNGGGGDGRSRARAGPAPGNDPRQFEQRIVTRGGALMGVCTLAVAHWPHGDFWVVPVRHSVRLPQITRPRFAGTVRR